MKVLFADLPAGCSAVPDRWMSGMDQGKRKRIERLRFETDKAAAVTAHRLLCRGLKEIYGIVPSVDGWGEGKYGKPYLKGRENVHFSISHSGGIAMCAFHDTEVGADIETVRAAGEGVARRIMSEDEWQAYNAAQKDMGLFFKIWTLKEAFLKYSGTGIGSLDVITVYPQCGAIRSNAKGCRFALIDSIPGYQAAVCTRGNFELCAEFVTESGLEDF